MKESIMVEIEVDLESIANDSKNKEDARQLLNYRLEKSKQKAGEEFKDKYDDLIVEFEKKLDKIWKK
ncbi:hypothetical protein AKJ49_00790 [candidate division MSBL1 archaeon SCGC-AAA382A03]|uniref:Uncharacterized protein n=1 Tax=candidate division MSBL1 archaeon SCGC-AAA382A03 TaxID=1698278 RepID=A0A133VG72_9EURY|nr:hypothetical protein AKJ49_00790 [candidate division MSBL1 archaeon SCGC-AAA382A03]